MARMFTIPIKSQSQKVTQKHIRKKCSDTKEKKTMPEEEETEEETEEEEEKEED